MNVEATFTSPRDELDRATHYRPNMGKDSPELIVERDRCSQCGGTTCLTTTTGVRATFVRLHMDCDDPNILRLGQRR